MLTSIEVCAGAGGQALGLEMAGFEHVALVEYEKDYCDTLKRNRPNWNVICGDIRDFDGLQYRFQVDLLAGKQLGAEDERDLFPEMLRLVGEICPKAVMIENVRGFLDPVFEGYRKNIFEQLDKLGYKAKIKLLQASDYGVPQLRPRIVIIGIRKDIRKEFEYPEPRPAETKTVGETLGDLMKEKGWDGAEAWIRKADKIAPTIVGGSKKHGGPDLGPVRARKAWMELGVDGLGVANEAPEKEFQGNPRLTPRMIARIQGFPDDWDFGKRKTAACRMIGNAFPPPVAKAVGEKIREVLE